MGKNLFRLDGQIVAVFGAASGIGEAIARACAAAGARVACSDIDGEGSARTAAAITATGAEAWSAPADIREGTETNRFVDGVVSRFGALDAVVCTPAINVRKPLLRYSDEEFDRVVRVNLKGSFNVLRSSGRVLTASGRGSIVLFSSIRSQVVEPGQAIYAATKAAVVQMVRTAAAEFGPKGVRVNAVAPGVVETPLTAPIKQQPDWYNAYAAKSVLNRWARVEEIAGPTVFLLTEAASYITGSVLVVDGGWLAADGRFQPPGMSD